jgi:uncharacterized protein YecA (UPF0149 family)
MFEDLWRRLTVKLSIAYIKFSADRSAGYYREEFQSSIRLPKIETTITQAAKKMRTNAEKSAPKPVVNTQKELGRNDPCWCGSGKKFKKCHYPSMS